MKILKNRMFLGTLCLLLAALLAFVLAPRLQSAALDEVTVYAAKADIEEGALLTEENISETAVPKKYLPTGAATESENVVGKYAATAISAGEYFYESRLSEEAAENNAWQKELDENHLAVSFTIKTFASGLSAKLQPEDIVSLVAVDTREDGETVIPEELKYVRVLSLTTETGVDYDAKAPAAETVSLPVTVMVMATPEQAVRLAGLELNSNLHTALVCRGTDTERAATLLTEQAEVLETLKADAEENAENAAADTEVSADE